MKEKVKYIAAYIPAWVCYWIGHAVSRVMEKVDKYEFAVNILYPIYNKFMGWSLFFSDWGNVGVWLDAENKEE